MKRAAAVAIVVVGAVCATALAVAMVNPGFLVQWELRWELAGLDLAAPERDAMTALARGRPVCYSVNGYGTYFPGVDSEDDWRFCQTVEKNFKATSDYNTSWEQYRLNRQAERYATIFNRHIIRNRHRTNSPGRWPQ